MTTWIQKKDGEFENDLTFSAFIGFKSMDFTIKFFENIDEIDYQKRDLVIGNLFVMKPIMDKLAISRPDFYIPNELKSYAGRKIWPSTVGDVRKSIREDHLLKIFIKPQYIKQFPAQVADYLPLTSYPYQVIEDYWNCWASEVIDIMSEYRVFINRGEIVGVKHYLGDWKILPDFQIIENAIRDYRSKPIGFCLDFGVTNTGKTILIEMNDGYAIGPYGLDPFLYARLLRDRWIELSS